MTQELVVTFDHHLCKTWHLHWEIIKYRINLHRVKPMAIDYMSGIALIAMQQQDHTNGVLLRI